MKSWEDIDWSNPNCKITDNFTVHEALWLPSIKINHLPDVYERMNLVELLNKVQEIRNRINKPFIVISCIRPMYIQCYSNQYIGVNYNKMVNGSEYSPHMFGRAIDFLVADIGNKDEYANLRQKIVPWLEVLNLRMEDKDECKIHLDTYFVEKNRFFKP